MTSLVAANCRWEYDGQPFFEGEVEPCINGRTVTLGAYFGADVDGVVTRLLADQLDDGGWNCWTEHGATVSSFALDDLRARGPARVRADHGRIGRAERRPPRWRAVPARTFAVPPKEHGRGAGRAPGCSSRSRPGGTTTSCVGSEYFRRADAPGPAARRGGRARALQASARRHLAAREHPPRCSPLRARGRRRPPEPVEHAAGNPRARLVGCTRLAPCYLPILLGATLTGWCNPRRRGGPRR